MSNKFNDLFNEFFEDGSNEKPKKNSDTEKMARLLKILSQSKANEIPDIDAVKDIDSTLGEPDFVDYYEEDGFFYKKQIWITKMGRVVKKVMSDVPFRDEHDEPKFFKEELDKIKNTKRSDRINELFNRPKVSRPLEELLEEAVSKEDYELAATLRDEIKRRDENSENQ
jgi:hypothetical protein